MREIVLDIETTGLQYKDGDRIIDIACLELSNLIPTGRTYQTYVNPEGRKVGKSVEIHNLTDEFLQDKKLFKKVISEFLKFIKNAPLIVHNGLIFDIPFLNNELKLHKFNIIKNPIIDTVLLARKKFPNSPVNLDALCRRFDIDLFTRKKKHGALIDTKLLARVYLELKGGQQPDLNLKKSISYENKDQNINYNKKEWEERIYSLSIEEIDEHKKYIKKIKKPLWNIYN